MAGVRTHSPAVAGVGVALVVATLACSPRRDVVSEPTALPTPAPFIPTAGAPVDAPADAETGAPVAAPAEVPAPTIAAPPASPPPAQADGGQSDALGDELEDMLGVLEGMSDASDGLEDVPELNN